MSTDPDESLVRELAEPLVAEFSPAEQDELFDLLSEAHFADPDAYASPDRGGGPLAFGLPELSVLMTPLMLAAMSEVVRFVVAKALANGTKVTAAGIRRLLGRRRAQEPAQDEELTLTPQQWAEVREIVERVALKGGAPADRARALADTVVSRGTSGGDLT